MRRLETQADGRRLAIRLLDSLRDAGTERCRANVPPNYVYPTDYLIAAMLEIKERGTVDACIGFAIVLTDAIGTRGQEPCPELYEQMEAEGRIKPYKLGKISKRMRQGGLLLAALALQREYIANSITHPWE
jgi:hypothetical protein